MLPASRAEWSLIGSSLLLLLRASRVALVLRLVLPWLGCDQPFQMEARDGRWPGRHPKVGMRGGTQGGILLGWRLRLGGAWVRTRCGLPQQSQLPCPSNGLGTVGCAELVEDVGDVALDRVQGNHQLLGNR